MSDGTIKTKTLSFDAINKDLSVFFSTPGQFSSPDILRDYKGYMVMTHLLTTDPQKTKEVFDSVDKYIKKPPGSYNLWGFQLNLFGLQIGGTQCYFASNDVLKSVGISLPKDSPWWPLKPAGIYQTTITARGMGISPSYSFSMQQRITSHYQNIRDISYYSPQLRTIEMNMWTHYQTQPWNYNWQSTDYWRYRQPTLP